MRHTDYKKIAATYDHRYIDEDYSGIRQALLDFIGSADRRVLEVGCGTGHWLQGLLPIEAVGVDLSRLMLLRAIPKIPRRRLVQARAEELPFENGSFDRLFTINAHHHFSDKPQFFREARRVLAPSGSFVTIALDPHTGTDQWWVYDYFESTRDIDRERYPSCEQIRTWMREVGFADVHTREVQHLPGDADAREALQSGIVSPDHTSQLAVLTQQEFNSGLNRIRAALERDSSLRLSADLRVYATHGVLGN